MIDQCKKNTSSLEEYNSFFQCLVRTVAAELFFDKINIYVSSLKGYTLRYIVDLAFQCCFETGTANPEWLE